METMLNLGCGSRFHQDWINVDFASTGEGVIAHNLLQGIPFSDCHFDAVYHSHVLEHFSKEAAPRFLEECFRVLKPGGIIRIAVPDLERIAREYLKNLEGALADDEKSVLNYDWIMVELYDQTVRETSGGAYGYYWGQEQVPNEDYMVQRMGYEYRNARKAYHESKKHQAADTKIAMATEKLPARPPANRFLKPSTYINRIKKRFLKVDLEKITRLKQELHAQMQTEAAYAQLGRFRRNGEIHQWMYDRFSLKRLLETVGFGSVQQTTAYESRLPSWNSYELDTENGEVRKPDSLFMEAVKI